MDGMLYYMFNPTHMSIVPVMYYMHDQIVVCQNPHTHILPIFLYEKQVRHRLRKRHIDLISILLSQPWDTLPYRWYFLRHELFSDRTQDGFDAFFTVDGIGFTKRGQHVMQCRQAIAMFFMHNHAYVFLR